MSDNEIIVSVLCITYNQKKYIADALDSVLSQKVDFPFELIIHDDASNDGTIDILEKYKAKYPDIIRIFYEETNRYSKGEDFVIPIIRNMVRGKYIALCEGDDYWIDSSKLQRQKEALDAHQECDMCACWGCTVTEDGTREVSQIRPRQSDGILSIKEVVLGGGQFLVTAGLFFRKEMFDDLYGMDSLDYSQQIRGALRGGILYLDRKMAVYRRYTQGSWTNNVLKNEIELDKQWNKERDLLKSFDERTDYQYHEIITERLKAYTHFDIQLENCMDEIEEVRNQFELPIYIWGMGRRGDALDSYCAKKGYRIDGICDATNNEVGQYTKYNTKIVSTEYVIKNAKTILASNKYVYDDLQRTDYQGLLFNFQKFMPLG